MALALRIMNFQPKNSHTSPLFRKLLYYLLANLLRIFYLLSSIIGLFFPLMAINIITHGLLMINSKHIHTELTLMIKICSL